MNDQDKLKLFAKALHALDKVPSYSRHDVAKKMSELDPKHPPPETYADYAGVELEKLWG